MIDHTVFPQPAISPDDPTGFFPSDFVVESILDRTINWFRSTPKAADEVFGRLKMPLVAKRYGQGKIDEIAKYIRETEIRVIQSFPVEDTVMPVISINMGDSMQVDQLRGLGNYAGDSDVLGADDEVVSRSEIGYLPIQDSLLIGIHASGTPDKVKYLYYLVCYGICSSFDEFYEMGFHDVTLRATDMSRFNDLLPANVFTRFMTLSMTSLPKFTKGAVPMVDDFTLNVRT